ncbi:MAG: hypothetical protein P4L22_04030 [Candidatus Babeliales bacterium]|nr:hypothetical protein [Candidatus Babeliales bacterium]
MKISKLMLLLLLNSSFNAFAMDECKESDIEERKEAQEEKYIQQLEQEYTEQDIKELIWNQQEVDNGKHVHSEFGKVVPGITHIINEYLIGDSLEVSEEFLATVGLSIPFGDIRRILNTADNKYIIVCAREFVSIINTEIGQKIHTIKHKDRVFCSLSKDNKFLLTWSEDGSAKVYFFENGNEEIIIHNAPVKSGIISDDCKLIFTYAKPSYQKSSVKVTLVNDSSIFTLALNANSILNNIEHAIDSAVMASDNKFLVISTTDGNFYKIDLENTYEDVKLNFTINSKFGHYEARKICTEKHITPDNRYLIIKYLDRIIIYDLIENKYNDFDPEMTDHPEIFVTNDYLICKVLAKQGFPANEADEYKVYDIKKNNIVTSGKGPFHIFLKQYNKFIYTVKKKLPDDSIEHIITINDLGTGNSLEIKIDGIIKHLQVCPNEKYLIIIKDSSFLIYDLIANRFYGEHEMIPAAKFTIKFEEKLNQFFIISNNELILFDLQTKTIVKTYNQSARFFDSNDKYCVFSNAANGEVIGWNLQDNAIDFQIKEPAGEQLIEDENQADVGIKHLKIFNEHYLAIVSHDKTEIFDLDKNTILRTNIPTISYVPTHEDFPFRKSISRFLEADDKVLIGRTHLEDRDLVGFNNKLSIHKFDKKSWINKLNAEQIACVIGLYKCNEFNRIKEENGMPTAPLKLSEEMLKTFNTLPFFMQNALMQKYFPLPPIR